MLRTLTFIGILFAMNPQISLAQCPECEPDLDCGFGAQFPTTCPEVLPAGVAGEYYEEVITFFMPADVEADGISATLDEIVINSINGLPFGMEITINDEDNTYYPGEGQNYGCATICGTPLLEGQYDISINVQITATAFGFEQVLNESFISPLLINEGESSNTSFSYDNVAGCGSLEVLFEALIDGTPNPTEYEWDFGNGNTSDMPDPVAQSYNSPGDYTVTLETTIFEFLLTEVIVSSVSNDGDNDLDELFGVLAPDPYIVVLNDNGDIIYSSDSVDSSDSATFSDLNVLISSEGYTIQIWDSDTLTPDDLLGEYSISELIEGTGVYNDGGTQGSYSILRQVNSVFIDEQIISVFEIPNSTLEFNELVNALSIIDESAIEFVWTYNGEVLVDETQSSILISNPGVYQCTVSNEYGCSSMSEEFILCPDVSIQSAGDLVFVVGGFSSYTWFYNGLELTGEDGNSITYQGLGNYMVEITTDYGCTVESEVLSIETGISELDQSFQLDVYPNPALDFINVSCPKIGKNTYAQIYTATGKICLSEPIRLNSEITKVDVSLLPSGSYFLVVFAGNELLKSTRFMK